MNKTKWFLPLIQNDINPVEVSLPNISKQYWIHNLSEGRNFRPVGTTCSSQIIIGSVLSIKINHENWLVGTNNLHFTFFDDTNEEIIILIQNTNTLKVILTHE